ncbi:MAG: toll/interleukin-1 receptor domain-containing protein, partial [Cyanobacteria bacterium J06639_14]
MLHATAAFTLSGFEKISEEEITPKGQWVTLGCTYSARQRYLRHGRCNSTLHPLRGYRRKILRLFHPPPPPSSPSMSDFYDAFISYGRADSLTFVTHLDKRLTQLGYRIWCDFNDIPLAVDFQHQIDDGIAKSHNFLFIISPHSVNSAYCRKEIELAQR